MNNDHDADGPEEEPPPSLLECYAWEVLVLAAAHLRSMAESVVRPGADITAISVQRKLERVEDLLLIHADMTRPAPPAPDGEVPF